MRLQKYNFFPHSQSFSQEISSTPVILFRKRAYTKKKSDSLLINDSRVGLRGASSASAVMRRSARRHTVRHTWLCAEAKHPPGRTKECRTGSWLSMESMCFSNFCMWVVVMEQGDFLLSVWGMARCVPTSNKRVCIHRSRLVSSLMYDSTIASSRPMWELSSSMVP